MASWRSPRASSLTCLVVTGVWCHAHLDLLALSGPLDGNEPTVPTRLDGIAPSGAPLAGRTHQVEAVHSPALLEQGRDVLPACDFLNENVSAKLSASTWHGFDLWKRITLRPPRPLQAHQAVDEGTCQRQRHTKPVAFPHPPQALSWGRLRPSVPMQGGSPEAVGDSHPGE